MVFFQLFWVFFKIGAVSFGGGLAMLPLIERYVVNTYSWVTVKEFYNIVAVAQVTPGAISINSATYVGQKVAGPMGSIVATFGLCLPSFLLMFFLYKILVKYKENKLKVSLFKGVKAVSVALIFYAAYSIGGQTYFSDGQLQYRLVIISIISYILLQSKKVHPMLMLGISAFLGYLII
jgi:chromate transporter